MIRCIKVRKKYRKGNQEWTIYRDEGGNIGHKTQNEDKQNKLKKNTTQKLNR